MFLCKNKKINENNNKKNKSLNSALNIFAWQKHTFRQKYFKNQNKVEKKLHIHRKHQKINHVNGLEMEIKIEFFRKKK